MSSPNETTGVDAAIYAAIVAAIGYISRKWLAKINPWPLAQRIAVSLNEPLMVKHTAPILDGLRLTREEVVLQGALLDRVCRVLDSMEKSKDAHAAIAAEDAEKIQFNKRWHINGRTGTGG